MKQVRYETLGSHRDMVLGKITPKEYNEQGASTVIVSRRCSRRQSSSRLIELSKDAAAWVLCIVICAAVITSPFTCVYGCRAAWVAGGR